MSLAKQKEATGLRHTGLGFCKAVDESLNQYRYDKYYCSRFIEECLRKGKPEDKIGARDLFHAFQNWNLNNDNDDSIPVL
jgi:hypothetical protein